MIVNGFPPGTTESDGLITSALNAYSEMLTGWATNTASRMLEAVNIQDKKAWRERSEEISKLLQREIRDAPVGLAMQELLAEQILLIKNIPEEAAQRVHELTIKLTYSGDRAESIIAEIMRSGSVAEGRARTIARTEVSRASSVLTQSRAQSIGSDGYVWRTSGDLDVRHSHKEMNGKFVPWSRPPTLDGMTGHAGCLPNCRCYPEPIIPD